MSQVDVIDSGKASALEQMAHDQRLIDELSRLKRPVFRLYRFKKKSITYGYFQNIHNLINCERAQALGFDVARRPTGGGALFHWADFSFTVAMPAHHHCFSDEVLANYHLINETLLDALVSIDAFSHLCLYGSEKKQQNVSHFCMARPSKYDLTWQGKKIGGSSQRKTKFGFVHQSSLFLLLPDFSEVFDLSLCSFEEVEAMKHNSSSLFEAGTSQKKIDTFCFALADQFVDSFVKRLK